MRILCTNDDGFFATGLQVLERVASRFGDVVSVAPDREKSGISNAITLNRPLRIHEPKPGRFILDGTPTDCIWLALNHIMPNDPPDLILSGINHGPNVGHDVLYSGTVAGAVEGAMQGIPSMALSFLGMPDWPFEAIEGAVEEVLGRMVDHLRLEPGATAGNHRSALLLNINIPHPDQPGLRGSRITSLGMRYYSKEVVERSDPRGKSYVWIGGARITHDDIPGSDCNALAEGHVSITPIHFDLTDTAWAERLSDWNRDHEGSTS